MENVGSARLPERADWITRLVAEVIDVIVWSMAFIPVAVGIGVGGALPVLVGVVLSLGALAVIASAYRDGRSVGKRVMGTRVVRTDGSSVSWGFNFIVRAILVKGLVVGIAGQITFSIFTLINYLWPLWDKERQALHDKMASTYVVRAR